MVAGTISSAPDFIRNDWNETRQTLSIQGPADAGFDTERCLPG